MSLRLVREKVEFLMFFFGWSFVVYPKKKKKNTKFKGFTHLDGDIVVFCLF